MLRKRVCSKFWQDSWLGIDFNTLKINLNHRKLANEKFYTAFYTKLFQKFKNYNDLPEYWIEEKTQTANLLSKYLVRNAEFLSYGAGIGFIEKHLSKIRPDLKISVFDFSNIASKWLIRECQNVTHITKLEKLKTYDAITMIQLFSAMPTHECIDLLKNSKRYLNANGVIILTYHPVNEFRFEIKNSTVENIYNIFNIIRPFIYRVKVYVNRRNLQFWGWQRNDIEIEYIINKSELKIYKKFNSINQHFYIVKT